jgi:F5/8 type C domain
MVASRIWCALALLCFAACSFPDYRTPSSDGALGASCHDGVRNGEELGVDCGPICNSDCPPCSDGMQNGNETGVDCGGRCGACPTCQDALQNGSESDVDCGGTCAKRCDPSQRCRENADCASLVCATQCQPSDCNDHVRNGHETGVDCGGGCPGCKEGSACTLGSDCQSKNCQNQVCVSAGCTDGVMNDTETDEDCGGVCAPCKPSKTCKVKEDCDSHICSAGACSTSTCSDGVLNQGESAPDCGGPGCAPCAAGKSCSMPGDCESALCQNGTCVPKNASGQPLDKAKWRISSSEGATEMGTSEAADGDLVTCWTSGEAQYSGMYVDVDLGEPQIFFKLLLQVTEPPFDQDFPLGIDVLVSNDGNFGDPAASGVMGNQWTWVDFVSAQVGRYVRFRLNKPGPRSWSIGEVNLYN